MSSSRAHYSHTYLLSMLWGRRLHTHKAGRGMGRVKGASIEKNKQTNPKKSFAKVWPQRENAFGVLVLPGPASHLAWFLPMHGRSQLFTTAAPKCSPLVLQLTTMTTAPGGAKNPNLPKFLVRYPPSQSFTPKHPCPSDSL